VTGDMQMAAKSIFARCVPNYQTECIEATRNFTHNGYGRCRVNGRKMLSHRVVYEARKGPIPDGMQVMHSCDNRRCCNPMHLSLGTGQDNTNDRKTKDRLGFKINTAQTLEIIRLVRTGRKQSEVAKMFGLAQSSVSRIVAGKKWAHVHNIGGTEVATVASVY
jgi:predicted XRE-type DNA-binding protein